mgnify:CR=1 FL=1
MNPNIYFDGLPSLNPYVGLGLKGVKEPKHLKLLKSQNFVKRRLFKSRGCDFFGVFLKEIKLEKTFESLSLGCQRVK